MRPGAAGIWWRECAWRGWKEGPEGPGRAPAGLEVERVSCVLHALTLFCTLTLGIAGWVSPVLRGLDSALEVSGGNRPRFCPLPGLKSAWWVQRHPPPVFGYPVRSCLGAMASAWASSEQRLRPADPVACVWLWAGVLGADGRQAQGWLCPDWQSFPYSTSTLTCFVF